MRILRWIFYLALAAAMIYGGYFAYLKWMNGEPISSLWQKAQQYASTTQGTVRNVSDTVSAAQKTVQSVQSTVASATSAFDAAKETVGNLLGGIGEGIQGLSQALKGATSSPASTSTAVPPAAAAVSVGSTATAASSDAPLPATITTSVGAPLYFSMASGNAYSISWGDGTVSSGALDQGEPTVVRHAWSSAGNYSVKVTVDGGSYTFPIRVYNQ
ncbi:hypothetical protein M1432_02130 [Patescibacteria group bacterium]|nr:hypothetical protein [Patescibacteria group bacterium]